MASFAEIDDNNVVLRVSLVKDSVPDGAEFISNLLGGNWVKSSTSNVKKMAGPGAIYIAEEEGFQPPSPFPSWAWKREAWRWEAPVPMPASSDPYAWNEDGQSWDKIL